MLTVLAAMKVELEGPFGLNKSSTYWAECDLVYTGIGRKNALETLENLKGDPEMEGILSVGFVGSIDPEVKPGDLCLVDRVQASDRKDSFFSDRDWQDRASSALEDNYRTCGLLTVEDTVSGVEEKRSLIKVKGASIVDQETYWVARAADERDLPFLSLRVVSDGLDQELPPKSCYDVDSGRVRPGRVLAWLAREPGRFVDLTRLGVNSFRARRRLAGAVNSVVPALMS